MLEDALWLHVGLRYDRPARPTFLQMCRREDGDRDDTIGLQVYREGMPLLPRWLTAYEAYECTNYTNAHMMMQIYRLVADTRRVAVLRPCWQRVREYPGAPICDVFAAKRPPPKPRNPQAAKAKAGPLVAGRRGRGVGKGGRGRQQGRGRHSDGVGAEAPVPLEAEPPREKEGNDGWGSETSGDRIQ